MRARQSTRNASPPPSSSPSTCPGGSAVAPGWMEGDWMQRMLKDKYEDLMGKRAKATPLKRVVTAEDVAIPAGFKESK